MVIHFKYSGVIPREDIRYIITEASGVCLELMRHLVEVYELDESIILSIGKIVSLEWLCRHQLLSFDLYGKLVHIQVKNRLRRFDSIRNLTITHELLQGCVRSGREKW